MIKMPEPGTPTSTGKFVAGWLPAVNAASVQDDIELAQEAVTLALSTVKEKL